MVGLANDDPSIGEYERFLVGSKTTARKELVLVHYDQTVKPGITREWLKVFNPLTALTVESYMGSSTSSRGNEIPLYAHKSRSR